MIPRLRALSLRRCCRSSRRCGALRSRWSWWPASRCPGTASASQLIARDARDVTLRRQREGARRSSATPRRGSAGTCSRGARSTRSTRRPDRRAGRLPARLLGRLAARTARRSPSGSATSAAATQGRSSPWFVTGCTMPDGSHWAVQSWQRGLPNLGLDPWKPLQGSRELRLSRWSTRAAEARAVDELGVQQALPPRLRAPLVPRPARLRLPGVGEGSADGQLRAQHLPRHAQLGLRPRLEARELLPRAHRHRGVLLRLLPARPVPGLPRGRAPARRGRASAIARRRSGPA